jgi:hypothetical protein
MTISYVFPNTADIRQRGGLDVRRKLAESAGCSFVEIPADLIKNESEVTATGQDFCTFLTRQSIEKIYTATQNKSGTTPYILHTDPALNKLVRLQWNEPVWTEKFVRMITNISDFLGIPPAKVEIHPGDRGNSCADIVRGVKAIQAGYQDAFGCVPEILLENRTGQFISQGTQIAGLWDHIMQHNPELADSFGIVLDLQQLFTVTREKFLPSFYKIPSACLKGFHIHRLHRPPAVGDGIPWPEVFSRIASLGHDVIINPEVHHNNQVAGVIGFCEMMIKTYISQVSRTK